MNYKSYFFIKNKNKNQVLDFLLSMDKNIFQKTILEMKNVEKYGIDTKNCSIKKFQNGIWKIRTKDHSNNVRLFFYIIDSKIYYLYGFMKKTQKNPEGKKVTINNLKIDLSETLKLRNNESYFQEINLDNLLKLKK